MHTSPSNKRYIGITGQKPKRRWREDGYGYKDNLYFWKAIQKYGWDNFKHEILFEGLSKEEAEQKEIELISYYKSNYKDFGYNLSSGGESGSNGYKYNEEQREHMRKIHGGKNNPMYGKHHTKDTIEIERIKHMRENLSPETIYKMSIAKKGKKRSEESIKKQIESISNKVICLETSVVYNGTKEAGRLNNLDPSSISKVCRGERQTCGGFHWCYGD